MKSILSFLLFILLSGCAVVYVSPVDSTLDIKHVCVDGTVQYGALGLVNMQVGRTRAGGGADRPKC